MNNLNTFPSIASEKENLKFSETAKYLQEKFSDLENDYKTPDGNNAQSCSLIALEVASILKKEGRVPQIVTITGMKVDSVNTETLYPKRYEGRVGWGGHVVCQCDGLIYDPMVGIPMDKDTYLQTTFLNSVEEGEVVDLKLEE